MFSVISLSPTQPAQNQLDLRSYKGILQKEKISKQYFFRDITKERKDFRLESFCLSVSRFVCVQKQMCGS